MTKLVTVKDATPEEREAIRKLNDAKAAKARLDRVRATKERVRALTPYRKRLREHDTATARDGDILTPLEALPEDAEWMAALTPREQRELDELLAPETPKLTFFDFIRAVAPRYQFYWHCLILIRLLQQVADGNLKRLLVFMPPRHGKSELISRLFPAYLLHRHADWRIILACYGAELAYSMSAAARNYYYAFAQRSTERTTAVKNWSSAGNGGLAAAGVRGPLTGLGMNVGIVDDPVKNQEDAASALKQNANLEWWQSTFTTRQEPNAALIVTLTRWNENDLGAQIVRLEEEAAAANPDEAERWHVVCLPAIKDHYHYKWPSTCTVQPDPRRVGEVLCRERYPLHALKKQRRISGNYYFDALFQQRPRARDGVKFRWTWFRKVARYDGPGARVLYVDTAGTDGELSPSADYTAMTFMAMTPEYRFVVEHAERGQWSPGRRDHKIRAVAEAMAERYSRTGFTIVVEQESGVDSADRIASMRRVLAGFKVEVRPARGSKADRADPLAQQAEFGNLFLVQGDWNAEFIDEHCGFPNAEHDDWVDSTSGALAWLAATIGTEAPAVGPVLGPSHNPYGDIS